MIPCTMDHTVKEVSRVRNAASSLVRRALGALGALGVLGALAAVLAVRATVSA
jgi:hypothetical protein